MALALSFSEPYVVQIICYRGYADKKCPIKQYNGEEAKYGKDCDERNWCSLG